MDDLPEECAELVKEAVSVNSFTSCYHMAAFLDDTDMLRFLASKIFNFETVAGQVVETFSVDDMHSLLSLAPPGLEPLIVADLWVKHDEGRRSCCGEALFKSFQIHKLNCRPQSMSSWGR